MNKKARKFRNASHVFLVSISTSPTYLYNIQLIRIFLGFHSIHLGVSFCIEGVSVIILVLNAFKNAVNLVLRLDDPYIPRVDMSRVNVPVTFEANRYIFTAAQQVYDGIKHIIQNVLILNLLMKSMTEKSTSFKMY